jgi:hypothetical protein
LAPSKCGAVHNISPSLEKQLVLELEVWVLLHEVLQLHPSSFSGRSPLPTNQELLSPTSYPTFEHLLRRHQHPTILKRRKHRQLFRRVTMKRFQ